MQLTYLVLLAAAIGGSYVVSHSANLGKLAQQAALWFLIFVGVVGAYGLWEDISRDVNPRQAVISDTRIEVPRSFDGHYYLTLEINQTPVRFVIDTGATQMVLSQQDADRIGIKTEKLDFFSSANTANGVVQTAPVVLDAVALGAIRDTQVPAVVNGGPMDESLLGMTYLQLYDRIEIANDQLILSR